MIKKALFLLGCIAGLSIACGISAFAGGWEQDQYGYRYQMNDGSYMVHGWILDDNNEWYYIDENGYMSSGWIETGGRYYYCDPATGIMQSNTVIDGYYLGPDGAWDPSADYSTSAAGSSSNSGEKAGVFVGLERNTIKATVDGVERVFYLTSSHQYGDILMMTAYSVEDNGVRQVLGPHIKLDLPYDIEAGTVLTEEDIDCDCEISYGKTPDTTSYQARAEQKWLSSRGEFVCEVMVNESNGAHVSGTFSAVLQRYPKGSETIEVTDGAFDLYTNEKVDWVTEILSNKRKSLREIEYGDGTFSGDYSSDSSSGGSSVDHTCRTCHGSGLCNGCGGDGLKQNRYNYRVYDCTRCSGTGRCTVCFGTGKVY